MYFFLNGDTLVGSGGFAGPRRMAESKSDTK